MHKKTEKADMPEHRGCHNLFCGYVTDQETAFREAVTPGMDLTG